MKKIIALALIFGTAVCSADNTKDYRYAQSRTPNDFNIFQTHVGAYFSGKSVYSMLDLKICTLKGEIKDIELNPTGTSVAVIWQKGKTSRLSIYDIYKQDSKLAEPKLEYNPEVMTYSCDGRIIYVADETGEVHELDAKTFVQKSSIKLPFVPARLKASPNGDFLIAQKDNLLQVRIIKGGELRKEIDLGVSINDFTFAPDNSYLAILLSSGVMMEYDTATFLPGEEIDALGISRSLAIHKDNKYVAVVTADSVIAIINRMDSRERDYFSDNDKGADRLAFPSKSPELLSYNTEHSIVYHRLPMIQPNYQKLIADEVAEKMEEWLKQMPGETLEDYHERVNEETRAKQVMLFEEEIATRMAEGQLEAAQISLGSYNSEAEMLSLTFDNMPSIFLNVPESKLGSFSRVEDLEFRNARYGVARNDKFELVYVEVYNKKTGASFIFDNRERKSLEYLRTSDDFVPLSIMQLSNMDELRLEEIKDNVVKDAKDRNTISNHTQISVNTKVEKDVDAYGNKILNYNVGFTYNVEKEFSAQEDFAPGRYHLEESYAAKAMSDIIKNAFEGEFSQYIKAGKKVKVSITGMADNLKINKTLPYDGAYGEFVDEPVYGETLYAITVTRETGINENDQLALVRAAGVKQFIQKNVPALSSADAQYEYHIVVSNEEGGAFRRISVTFTFYDAF